MIALIVALAALAACGTRAPQPDGSLTGRVVIAERGAMRETVDQRWIDAHPPDLSWGQGRAWTLDRFFSDRWKDDGFELRVSGPDGEAVVFEEPGSRRDGRAPMLVLNQKGVPLVTLAGADGNPDSFHGRGGARQRSGDESPRVIGVTRIELLAAKGAAPGAQRASGPSPGQAGPLRVVRAGGEPRSLTVDALSSTQGRQLMDASGSSRGVEFWDLRAWAGDDVLTAVVDGSGTVTEVPPGLWSDATKIPSLRVNRRGAWRFEWLTEGGVQLRDLPSAANVVELRLRAP